MTYIPDVYLPANSTVDYSFGDETQNTGYNGDQVGTFHLTGSNNFVFSQASDTIPTYTGGYGGNSYLVLGSATIIASGAGDEITAPLNTLPAATLNIDATRADNLHFVMAEAGALNMNFTGSNAYVELDSQNIFGTITGGSGNGDFEIYAPVSLNLNGAGNVVNYFLFFSGGVIAPGSGNDTVNIQAESFGAAAVHLLGYQNTVNVAGASTEIDVTGGAGMGAFTLSGNVHATVGGMDNVFHLTGLTSDLTVGEYPVVVAGAGHDSVFVDGGVAQVTVNGAANLIDFAKDAGGSVQDNSSALDLQIQDGAGNIDVFNFGADRGDYLTKGSVIDLEGGAGGYTTAAQAAAALVSDGTGGYTLAIDQSTLHLHGVSGLSAANFLIG